jgi:VWFA-related protein
VILNVSVRAVTCAVICVVTVFAQEAPPVFRSGIDLITIPVRVLDPDGQPVAGLTAADFTVQFDDEPRAVASVQSVRDVKRSADPRTRPRVLSFSTNAAADAGIARTILLVIDTGGLDTTAARSVATEAERLLAELPPQDLVGLTQIPQATAAVDPTTDREQVRAALDKVTGAVDPPFGTYHISSGEAILIERKDPFMLEEVVRRECLLVAQEAAICQRDVTRQAMLLARETRESGRRRLRSLTALVNALPATADLKHVVLLTPGLFHEPGSEAFYDVLGSDLAVRTATLSILQVEGNEGSAESRLLAGGPDSRILNIGAQLLANAAGGDLLRMGTVATRFRRFRRELDAYYVVAVSAEPRDIDGKPHRISVNVRTPKATIQYPPTVVRAASPAHPDEADRLAAVMRRPGIERAIPLGVQATTVRGDDPKRLQVVVITRIPDAAVSNATIAIEVRDGSRVVTAHRGRLEPGKEAGGVLSHVSPILVPPGRYVLRVAVLDERWRAGSVDHPFVADLPPAGPLRTSGLIVGQTTDGALRPAIDMSTGLPIAGILELYSLDPATKADAAVSFTIASVADGSVSRRVGANVQRTETEGIQRAVASIDARDLPAGEYRIRAEVRVGGQAAVVDRHVVLHAAASPTVAPETLTEGTVEQTVPPIVERAAAYVDRYLQELSNIVMDETYRQQRRLPANVGTLNTGQVTVRTLGSEVLLARLPPPAGPTAFRDVLTVDRQPVHSRDDRLRRLFMEQQPGAAEQAQRITRESSRFNLGSAFRTLNLPTVPLLFVRGEHTRRLQWTTHGEETVAGRRLTRMQFKDRRPPTLLHTPAGADVLAEGELWIDPESGAVWRAAVSIEVADATRRSRTPDLEGDISVVFKPHDEWGLLVPQEMIERYVLRNGEENTGRAEYANYRRFSVQTKEEIPPP